MRQTSHVCMNYTSYMFHDIEYIVHYGLYCIFVYTYIRKHIHIYIYSIYILYIVTHTIHHDTPYISLYMYTHIFIDTLTWTKTCHGCEHAKIFIWVDREREVRAFEPSSSPHPTWGGPRMKSHHRSWPEGAFLLRLLRRSWVGGAHLLILSGMMPPSGTKQRGGISFNSNSCVGHDGKFGNAGFTPDVRSWWDI